MNYFIALLIGILLSSTVLFNGELNAQYGLYASAIINHVIGLALIGAIAAAKRDRPFYKMKRWHYYIGGSVGYLTLMFNTFAYGRISVTAILALCLLGQSVSSLLVDRYGFFGMNKYPFNKLKFIGMIIVLAGIAVMIEKFDLLAVILSFGSGVSTVVSRSINAKLTDATNMRVGTFYNYVSGLAISIVGFLILGGSDAIYSGFVISPNFYIYMGGIVGVVLVTMNNYVVSKISAFYLSLFMFVGQVFTGMIIDGVILGEFSVRALIGGLLVAAGMVADLFISRKREAVVS